MQGSDKQPLGSEGKRVSYNVRPNSNFPHRCFKQVCSFLKLTWESCGAFRQAASTSIEHTGSSLTCFLVIAHKWAISFMKDKQFHKTSQNIFHLTKSLRKGFSPEEKKIPHHKVRLSWDVNKASTATLFKTISPLCSSSLG